MKLLKNLILGILLLFYICGRTVFADFDLKLKPSEKKISTNQSFEVFSVLKTDEELEFSEFRLAIICDSSNFKCQGVKSLDERINIKKIRIDRRRKNKIYVTYKGPKIRLNAEEKLSLFSLEFDSLDNLGKFDFDFKIEKFENLECEDDDCFEGFCIKVLSKEKINGDDLGDNSEENSIIVPSIIEKISEEMKEIGSDNLDERNESFPVSSRKISKPKNILNIPLNSKNNFSKKMVNKPKKDKILKIVKKKPLKTLKIKKKSIIKSPKKIEKQIRKSKASKKMRKKLQTSKVRKNTPAKKMSKPLKIRKTKDQNLKTTPKTIKSKSRKKSQNARKKNPQKRKNNNSKNKSKKKNSVACSAGAPPETLENSEVSKPVKKSLNIQKDEGRNFGLFASFISVCSALFYYFYKTNFLQNFK